MYFLVLSNAISQFSENKKLFCNFDSIKILFSLQKMYPSSNSNFVSLVIATTFSMGYSMDPSMYPAANLDFGCILILNFCSASIKFFLLVVGLLVVVNSDCFYLLYYSFIYFFKNKKIEKTENDLKVNVYYL